MPHPLESNGAHLQALWKARKSPHSVNAATWLFGSEWKLQLALRPSSDSGICAFGCVFCGFPLGPFFSSCLALVQFARLTVWLSSVSFDFHSPFVTRWPQGNPLISHPLAQLSNFLYLSNKKDTADFPPLDVFLYFHFVLFQFHFATAESEIMTASSVRIFNFFLGFLPIKWTHSGTPRNMFLTLCVCFLLAR